MEENEWIALVQKIDVSFIVTNCLMSTTRVAVGVCIAIVLGIIIGLMRSSLPGVLKSNRCIKFLFVAPTCPPPIAWIPFVILLFGIGELSAYTIVFIGAFTPISINAYEGIEAVPRIIRHTAQSLEVRGIRYYTHVILPAALPQIFTGIRGGISFGWMSVIAAEMISGQSGLGYSIQLNRIGMQYDLMCLDMILIGTIGFALHQGAFVLERLAVPYQAYATH